MPTKIPPQRKTAEPVLEDFYNLRQAAVRLKLADKDDPEDVRGQDWLRRGFNRPEDGSKGRKFPGLYMAGQLMFSDSDLAVIAEIARSEPRAKSSSHSRRPRRKATATSAS